MIYTLPCHGLTEPSRALPNPAIPCLAQPKPSPAETDLAMPNPAGPRHATPCRYCYYTRLRGGVPPRRWPGL